MPHEVNLRVLNATTCCLLVIAVAGCQRTAPRAQPAYSGGNMGSYSWSRTATDTDPLPGIDYAHLWCWWIGNKPGLLIWSDVESATGRSTATPDGGFEGRYNHIPIKFHGKTKTLTIAGTDYKMTSGSLFLISIQKANPVVKQLNRNVAELEILKAGGTGIDNKKLKALAKTDADISAFWVSRQIIHMLPNKALNDDAFSERSDGITSRSQGCRVHRLGSSNHFYGPNRFSTARMARF